LLVAVAVVLVEMSVQVEVSELMILAHKFQEPLEESVVTSEPVTALAVAVAVADLQVELVVPEDLMALPVLKVE
jgi:hypothetical protein